MIRGRTLLWWTTGVLNPMRRVVVVRCVRSPGLSGVKVIMAPLTEKRPGALAAEPGSCLAAESTASTCASGGGGSSSNNNKGAAGVVAISGQSAHKEEGLNSVVVRKLRLYSISVFALAGTSRVRRRDITTVGLTWFMRAPVRSCSGA